MASVENVNVLFHFRICNFSIVFMVFLIMPQSIQPEHVERERERERERESLRRTKFLGATPDVVHVFVGALDRCYQLLE